MISVVIILIPYLTSCVCYYFLKKVLHFQFRLYYTILIRKIIQHLFLNVEVCDYGVVVCKFDNLN